MKQVFRLRVISLSLGLLLCAPAAPARQATEKNLDTDRSNGIRMLKVIKDELRRYYYDPTFHGFDLDARFKLAEEKIKQAMTSGQVLGIIAQAVVELNDSHTVFIPPMRDSVTVYGWRMQIIGDACYVTNVLPGSDAEAKGIRAGDRVLTLDGNEPTRATMWKMKYYYYGLRPKARVRIKVQSPGEPAREIEVLTKTENRRPDIFLDVIVEAAPISPELGASQERSVPYQEFGTDLIVYRLPSFRLEEDEVDKIMKRIGGHKTLILDLRGNSGGHEDALERFVGYFFDHEVKIGDYKQRKETREVKVKPRKSNAFAGDVIVLIDSESSSAAEIFARLLELEKRGMVIGDRSSGMVMESIRHEYEIKGFDERVLYGMMITDADIVMTDGKSLEWNGVMPDKLMLPTPDDIRERRDPVLAYAATLAGVKLDAEKAGTLFAAKGTKKDSK
jgi:C-terminal processing protease CtpA/Prc